MCVCSLGWKVVLQGKLRRNQLIQSVISFCFLRIIEAYHLHIYEHSIVHGFSFIRVTRLLFQRKISKVFFLKHRLKARGRVCEERRSERWEVWDGCVICCVPQPNLQFAAPIDWNHCIAQIACPCGLRPMKEHVPDWKCWCSLTFGSLFEAGSKGHYMLPWPN